jgi:hydrogenase maturation protease
MPLVLAYGNPLRGDDGVGWRIAEMLRGEPGTEIVCVHQLVPELAGRISGADGVLFLDAAAGDGLGRVTLRHVRADAAPGSLGHVLTPDTLLYLARRLYGRTPPAVLLTVGGRDFAVASGLSSLVTEALPAAAEGARAALRGLAAVREDRVLGWEAP